MKEGVERKWWWQGKRKGSVKTKEDLSQEEIEEKQAMILRNGGGRRPGEKKGEM